MNLLVQEKDERTECKIIKEIKNHLRPKKELKQINDTVIKEFRFLD